MHTADRHVVFITLEHFSINAFWIASVHPADSISSSWIYKGHTSQLLPVPVSLTKELFDVLIDELVAMLGVTRKNADIYFFSLEKASITLPGDIHAITESSHDLALAPYFMSSFLGFDYVQYLNLGYYTICSFDNKGKEVEKTFSGWEELYESFLAVYSIEGSSKELDMILNNMVRPVQDRSLYASIEPALMLSGLRTEETKERRNEHVCAIAGGEVFSYISSPKDVLFAFLTGEKETYPLISVYQDTADILSLVKYIKEYSLHLLESVSANLIRHTGDILRIYSRKPTRTSIVGRIMISDESGTRIIYPIVEDLLTMKVAGIGKVVCELDKPFFTFSTSFTVKDIFIVDTRLHERQNIMNYKGWYDRINSI